MKTGSHLPLTKGFCPQTLGIRPIGFYRYFLNDRKTQRTTERIAMKCVTQLLHQQTLTKKWFRPQRLSPHLLFSIVSISKSGEPLTSINSVLPADQTVNQYVYREILVKLRIRGMRVRTTIKDNWMIYIRSYSPDLRPCDFFLFPKPKSYLTGHYFRIIENKQT